MVIDSLGIIASAGGFGLVYGLSARVAGFSPLDGFRDIFGAETLYSLFAAATLTF